MGKGVEIRILTPYGKNINKPIALNLAQQDNQNKLVNKKYIFWKNKKKKIVVALHGHTID